VVPADDFQGEANMTKTTWTIGFFVLTMVLGLIPGPFIPSMSRCAFADSFNIKTGAWELTLTSVTTGMLVPPEMLEKMPSERRAKLEEAMQARSGQPKTRVHQKCITQTDLDENNFIKGEGEGETQCASKAVSKSPSKLVIERTCPAPHAATIQISVEAKTPKSIVGSIDGAIGAGKIHTDVKGHWLGTSCDEIKSRE
jgi:hypothetical protein